MSEPTKAERDAILAAAIRVLVPMVYSPNMPNPRRMGDAVTTSILVKARELRGSVRGAASMVGVPPSTFQDQIHRGYPDACHYLPMHGQLDADLFPFIRIRWDNSDLDFVAQYAAWMKDEIQPRAHDESTKVVLFQNYAPFQGEPTPEYVAALNSETKTKADYSVVRGVVIFAPTIPDMAQHLGLVTDSDGLAMAGLVRFATQPQAALDHATQLFSTAGVNAPTVHLD